MVRTEEWHELTAGELPKLLVDKLEPFGFVLDGGAIEDMPMRTPIIA